MNPILQMPFSLSLAGRTGSDADVSIHNGGSDLACTKAEKIAFPEGQNDILIHIAWGWGGGDLSRVTLHWMWVPCGVFWAARGEARRGYQRETDPRLKPQRRTTEVSCRCPAPASLCFNLSVTVFQRVNFKCKPKLSPHSEVSLCLSEHNLHFLLLLWEVCISMYVNSARNQHLSGWSGILIYWRRVHYQ